MEFARNCALRATYMSYKYAWVGVSDFMFGTVHIQEEGVRGIVGIPFLELLKRTNKPSWQKLHTTMKQMHLEDVVELGGFYCVLTRGYHCCNPPGFFLWEVGMGTRTSVTMNYNCLGKASSSSDSKYALYKPYVGVPTW